MNNEYWDQIYDTVIVGSGGSGLAAALTSAKHGARTLVVEKAPGLGGSTLFSGGLTWVPNNHLIEKAGIEDSIEEVMIYIESCLGHNDDKERCRSFLENCPDMLRYLESHTPLKFILSSAPASFAEKKGGKIKGRNVEPLPLSPNILGKVKNQLLDCPFRIDHPITLGEAFTFTMASINPFKHLVQCLKIGPRYVWRKLNGRVALGKALIVGLLYGCKHAGVDLMVSSPVKKLIQNGHRISGIEVEHGGKQLKICARKGVILATGGFEWNQEMVKKFLPAPIEYPVTTPYCTGDGHDMAQHIGARLKKMDQNMCWSAGYYPGHKRFHGSRLGIFINSLLNNPHCIVVNKEGKRFVNEASHNAAQAYFQTSEKDEKVLNIPAWSIFDSVWRSKYEEPEMQIFRKKPDPAWLIKAGSLSELARKTGINAQGLEQTVQRFNTFVRTGKDLDFHRGDFVYDWHFVPGIKPNPNLGTILEPPFYAVRIHTSTVGTKGGLMTDDKWQVISEKGNVISGLYAVGTVAAAIIGPITISASSAIGQCLTQGYMAGKEVAGSY